MLKFIESDHDIKGMLISGKKAVDFDTFKQLQYDYNELQKNFKNLQDVYLAVYGNGKGSRQEDERDYLSEINFLKRELVKCQNSLNEFVSLAEGEISQRNTEIENLENSIACLKNDIMKLNREMDFLVS